MKFGNVSLDKMNLDDLKLDDLKMDLSKFNTKVKETWNKLTDEDLKAVNGKFDSLMTKVQERYDFSPEDAKKRVQEFVTKLMPR